MKIRLSFLALIPALTVFAGELPPEAGNGLIEINGKRMNLALDPQGDITCRSLLADILRRAAGQKLPIYRKIDPKLDNYVIRFLSPRESAEMNRTDKDAVYFLLCEDGKTLNIGGNIRYGLYDFLKRFTPYRQFGGMPSEEVVPELKSIKLPENIRIFEKPDIASYLAGGTPNPYFSRADRMRSKGTHAFWEVIPPEVYGKTHPEFYPLIDGKRRVPPPRSRAGWQPCLANPELLKLTMEYADRYFKRNPRMISLPLGVNDSAGDCLCSFCNGEYEKYGNQYAGFYKKAAKALEKRHPGKLLSFIAYGKRSSAVPKNIRMEPNILVETIGINESLMREWKKTGIRHFGVYDYLYTAGGGFLIPRHFPHKQLERWRKLHREFGLSVLFNEYFPCETVIEGARQYVLDEGAWNLNADADALLKDYFDSMYGKSSAAVSRFFRRIEEVAERDPDLFSTFRYWRSPDQMKFYTRNDLTYLDAQLASAERTAQAEPFKRRLLRLKEFYALFRSCLDLYLTSREIADQKIGNDADLENLLRKLRRGYAGLEHIRNFRFSPGIEDEIFYKKRMSLEKFRSQYNLLPRPILERTADPALSRATAYLKRKHAADPDQTRQFWKTQAEKSADPELKALFLTQNYTDPENREYIVNGGFEPEPGQTQRESDPSGIRGWGVWRSSRMETDVFWNGEEKFSGERALAFGKNLNDMLAYTWGIVPAKGGRYRVTCRVKRNDATAHGDLGSVSIRKDWTNGSWLASAAVPAEAVGKWVQLEFCFTMPQDAKRVVFAVRPPLQSADSRLYIDDVSMRKIYDPAPPSAQLEK